MAQENKPAPPPPPKQPSEMAEPRQRHAPIPEVKPERIGGRTHGDKK
jgi:hypothetical protein